ncbi:MAG TPA: GGDEF domain-containing protein [Verrucomicrobiae bacterium]|nr:GGDEF domain-containing protein [Verrucomicrobiae bacterium]
MSAESPNERSSPDALLNQVQRLQAELLRTQQELAAAKQRALLAEELALVDPLTGLPNRRAWELALAREDQRCRRANHAAAIICLDLDRLKEENDSSGHAAGDELLQHTADALRKAIRAQDFAARLGGDEFGILLVECAGECVPAIIERLRTTLAEAGVAATLGWAARTNDADLHATWRKADQAMIAAK